MFRFDLIPRLGVPIESDNCAAQKSPTSLCSLWAARNKVQHSLGSGSRGKPITSPTFQRIFGTAEEAAGTGPSLREGR